KLVLKALTLVGRERHVVWVGADSEHLRINKLDRQIWPLRGLREHLSTQEHRRNRRARHAQAQAQPLLVGGIRHRSLLAEPLNAAPRQAPARVRQGSIRMSETTVLDLGGGLGLVFVLLRSSARNGVIGARSQVDEYVIEITHD